MDEIGLLRKIHARLKTYGTPRHGNPLDPVDDLVFIILSTQTEEYLYLDDFRQLKDAVSSWERLTSMSVEDIASLIKRGGLQNKKAKYVKGAIQKIRDDFGTVSLDKLSSWSDDDAIKYLKSLPGISAKGARCILMYTFGRALFPVDTHVWRICRRLGLTPSVPKPSPEQQNALEAKIPGKLRYSLHVNMLEHGRRTCTTYWPKCSQCVIQHLCPSKNKPDTVWGNWRKPGGIWAQYDTEGKDENDA